MPGDLPELLWEIVNATSRKDWTEVEQKANELKEWARACKNMASSEGANEYPDNGGKNEK